MLMLAQLIEIAMKRTHTVPQKNSEIQKATEDAKTRQSTGKLA
jgi:hypothetical protein